MQGRPRQHRYMRSRRFGGIRWELCGRRARHRSRYYQCDCTNGLSNDNLAGVSATYDRDPNSPGDTGDCSVTASGNEVSCSIASLEASDGNTDGPEPDVAVITIRATTTSDACGNVDNVASVSAENEPSANNGKQQQRNGKSCRRLCAARCSGCGGDGKRSEV